MTRTDSQLEDKINLPISGDIRWRRTWITRLLRLFPFNTQYRMAERFVNEANALRMASPKDGYKWVDKRKGAFRGKSITEQSEMVNKAMILEATRKEQEELNGKV